MKQRAITSIMIMFLISIMASSFISEALAAIELAYDNGISTGDRGRGDGCYIAVRFSLPPGLDRAKILTAKFYIEEDPDAFNLYIFDSDGSSVLLGPLVVTPTIADWFNADLSSYNIMVTGDFYIAVQFMDNDLDIGMDYTDPDGRSYDSTECDGAPGSWTLNRFDCDYMIRATVDPGPVRITSQVVGGDYYKINKLEVLTPYLLAISLISSIVIFSLVNRKYRFRV